MLNDILRLGVLDCAIAAILDLHCCIWELIVVSQRNLLRTRLYISLLFFSIFLDSNEQISFGLKISNAINLAIYQDSFEGIYYSKVLRAKIFFVIELLLKATEELCQPIGDFSLIA